VHKSEALLGPSECQQAWAAGEGWQEEVFFYWQTSKVPEKELICAHAAPEFGAPARLHSQLLYWGAATMIRLTCRK